MPKFPGLVERIKEVLEVRSQTEIAKKLGIADASISQWKSEGSISVDTLFQIAKLSNASINYLLTGQGSKYVEEAKKPIPPALKEGESEYTSDSVSDDQSIVINLYGPGKYEINLNIVVPNESENPSGYLTEGEIKQIAYARKKSKK